jgi:hypothetical protein
MVTTHEWRAEEKYVINEISYYQLLEDCRVFVQGR